MALELTGMLEPDVLSKIPARASLAIYEFTTILRGYTLSGIKRASHHDPAAEGGIDLARYLTKNAGIKRVVGIEETKNLAGHMRKTEIQCMRMIAILLNENLKSIGVLVFECLCDLQRIVARTPILDNNFKVRVLLIDQALQSVGEEMP